jgi:hypothetical protein
MKLDEKSNFFKLADLPAKALDKSGIQTRRLSSSTADLPRGAIGLVWFPHSKTTFNFTSKFSCH